MTRRTRRRRQTKPASSEAAAPERQWPDGMPPPALQLPTARGRFRNPTGKCAHYELPGYGELYWPCGAIKTLPPTHWEAAIDAGLEWAGFASGYGPSNK